MNDKMNHGVSLWGIVAALALLTGCSNDNEETGTPANGRVALEVTGGIQVNTRAHDNQWDANDAIGIYMLAPETTEVSEDARNRHYTTKTGGETGTFRPAEAGQTVYFPIDGSEVDFLAYYPYRTPLENDVYKVDVSRQEVQKDIDLMVSEAPVTGDKFSPAVAFRFKHRLVNLRLTIKTDGKVLTDEALEGMTVGITSQSTTADFDVLTRTLSNIGADKTELELLVTNHGKVCEGIVLPNTTTEGMQLVFTLTNGATFRWNIHSAGQSQSFVAGSQYKYGITITGTGLEVTSTVADRTPGNGEGENGNAE